MVTYDRVRQAFRTSPQQREIWRLDQGHGLGVRSVVRLEGAGAAGPVTAAVAAVVARHEILRTRFERAAGMRVPLQVIEAAGLVEVPSCDLRGLAPAAQAAALAELAPLAALGGGGPLLQLALAQVGARDQALVIGASALIADHVSIDLFVGEIVQHLTGAIDSDEPIQYAQYAEWQNELAEGADEDGAAGRAYWAARGGPWGASPVAVGSGAGRRRAWRSAAVPLDAGAGRALVAWAAGEGLAVDVVVEALWRVLLARVGGEERVVLGVAVDGRETPEVRRTLGPLARVLPVAVRVDGRADLRTTVQGVAGARREACEWQDLYEGPAVGLDVGVTHWAGTGAWRGAGVTGRCVGAQVAVRGLPLQLVSTVRAGAVRAAVQYDASRVGPAAAAALAAQWGTLVARALAAPGARAAGWPVVGASERRWQCRRVQGGRAAAHAPLVHTRLAAQAQARPTQVAVVGEDGVLTYAALEARTNQLARYLRRQGVRPECPVALAVERGATAVVGLLGILKAGGVAVPLELGQPAARLQQVLDEARVDWAVTTSRWEAQLPTRVTQRVLLDTAQAGVAAEADGPVASGVGPRHLAYVIFTSGSTGVPKGVAVEHGQLAHYVQAVTTRLGLRAEWRYATVSTLAADLGYTMVFGALSLGGTLHVVSAALAADAERLAAYLQEAAVDCLKIVPSHLEALLGGRTAAGVLPAHCLVLGGEASQWSLVRRVAASRPTCAVFNHYGPTETTVGIVTTALPATTADEGPVPLGRVLPGAQAFVLDPAGALAPVGAIGELYLGGPTVTRGYLHHPALTAARYLPDSFTGRPGARLYRTGDLARLRPDGTLEFHGRRDQQVKFHGFRVELGEIETVLTSHVNVREAVVVCRADPQGATTLVAYVVPTPGARVSTTELRTFLGTHLPDASIPSAFASLEAMPRLGNGKIDRAGLPPPVPLRREQSSMLPDGPIEEALAKLWCQILNLDECGVDENFLELGGHSLLAIQLVSLIQKTLQIEVPVRLLFDAPTVRALAEKIRELETYPGQQTSAARLFLKVAAMSPAQIAAVVGTHPTS